MKFDISTVFETLKTGTDPVIDLPAGKIHLDKPIEIDGKDYPNLSSLTINGHGTTLTGAKPLTASAWKEGKYGFFRKLSKSVPAFHDLLKDGKPVPLARSQSFVNPFDYANFKDRSDPENLKGLYVPLCIVEGMDKDALRGAEFWIYVEWEFHVFHITDIDFSDTCEADGVTHVRMRFDAEEFDAFIRLSHAILHIQGRECFIANSPLFLTDNSFAYDRQTRTLWYKGADTKGISLPVAENLLVFKNLSSLTVRGIGFTGTTSSTLPLHGYMSHQANADKRYGKLRHAAILTDSITGMKLERCRFTSLGGNGLLMANISRDVTIRYCDFTDIGMSAINIGNPTTNWVSEQNRTENVTVTRNTITRAAFSYPSAAAIYLSMVDGLKLTRNTIHETAYSAISLGWGWELVSYKPGEQVNLRNVIVSKNRITEYMQVLFDGAAIYCVGANCSAKYKRRFNFMRENYCERTGIATRKQRGYYLDGSASNWEMDHNVCVNSSLPVFSQYVVPEQFTHHNHIHHMYGTDEIAQENHVPKRDTIVDFDTCVIADSKEKLFEICPEAEEIWRKSGR